MFAVYDPLRRSLLPSDFCCCCSPARSRFLVFSLTPLRLPLSLLLLVLSILLYMISFVLLYMNNLVLLDLALLYLLSLGMLYCNSSHCVCSSRSMPFTLSPHALHAP